MQTDISTQIPQELQEASLKARASLLGGDVRALEMRLRDLYTSAAFTRTYPLVGPLGGELSLDLITSLHSWQRTEDEPRDVVINLNSDGEYDQFGHRFTDTFALIDVIRRFQSKGHKVIIQVTGTASRQAVALLQIADERIITPSSYIILAESQFPGFHSGSDGARDEIKFRKSLEEQANAFLLNRTKISAEQLKDKTEHDQSWMVSADEALKLGIVDRVGVHKADPYPFPDMPIAISGNETTAELVAKYDIQRNFLRSLLNEKEIRELEAATQSPRELYFFGGVSHVSCGRAIMSLQRFAHACKPCEVDFYLNSPGGSVHDGLSLMDVMEEVKASGHKINVIVLGQAASMGGFILQAASHRVIGKNARVLIHRISRIFRGTGSQLEQQEEQMARLEAQALPRLAARSKLSVEQIQEKCDKNDWWLTAEEALEHGFVDEII